MSIALLAAAMSCFGRDVPNAHACDPGGRDLKQQTLADLGLHGQPDRCFGYADKTGEYRLYLVEPRDRHFDNGDLSGAVDAQLFKAQADGTLARQWALHDQASRDEAGIRFEPDLFEFVDLNHDGEIVPVVVYRLLALVEGDARKADEDGFSGRIKIIAYVKGSKVAIRARSGDLDGERETTASPSYFELPTAARKHFVHKMSAMYHDRVFGFDNSYDFVPQKETHR